jgi:dGTPase
MMNWNSLLSKKRSSVLQGKREKTSQHVDDPRSEFDRDYGRAVFATPVRRLQDKAQVFPLEPNDSVRTRLTHSLEVSALARSIARWVVRRLLKTSAIDADQAAAIETIAMTCGLLHDIGNPPFGHSGEDAMREWYAKLFESEKALKEGLSGANPQYGQDFLEFEGNAQTLRLVTQLQMLADRHGLNLTCGTLSALCKYTAASNDTSKVDHSRSKPGYFASEAVLVGLIRAETGTGSARNPITYLVEAADDTVYATVDLEDGVKKGVIDWEFLKEQLRLDGRDTITEKVLEAVDKYGIDSELMATKRQADESRVQLFRTFAMVEFVRSASLVFEQKYDSIMAGEYTGELLVDGDSAQLLKRCKKVARQFVYTAPQTLRLEIMGRNVIHSLLDTFWGAARLAPDDLKSPENVFARKAYSLLSHNYLTTFQTCVRDDEKQGAVSPLPLNYRRLQLLADYIAGMTDTFATSLSHELGVLGKS